MNCLEFRRAVGADPRVAAAAVLTHAAECPACARYREDMQHMDRLIYRSLSVDMVDVQPHREQRTTRRAPLPRWAAAAGFAFACVVGLALWLSAPRETLARQIVEHVEAEPGSLIAEHAVHARDLEAVLSRLGIRLHADAGKVTYAMRCWFRGRYVAHLVVDTESGPVTLLVLPGEQEVQQRHEFEDGAFRGIIVPAPRGAVAILARDEHALQAAQRLLSAIEYQS